VGYNGYPFYLGESNCPHANQRERIGYNPMACADNVIPHATPIARGFPRGYGLAVRFHPR